MMKMTNQSSLMLLLFHHSMHPEVSQEQIHEDIKKYVIDAVVDPAMIDENTKYFH